MRIGLRLTFVLFVLFVLFIDIGAYAQETPPADNIAQESSENRSSDSKIENTETNDRESEGTQEELSIDKNASGDSETNGEEPVSNSSRKVPDRKQTELGSPKEVKWYFPELREKVGKSRVRVLISGKTSPGVKVRLGAKRIPIVIKGKVKKMKSRLAYVKKSKVVTADEKGIFVYPLNLPEGEVRLPLKVKFRDGEIVNYQLNLNIRKESVQITNQGSLARSPAFRKNFGIWGGAGFNYVRFEQVTQDIDTLVKKTDLLFESFKLPSLFLKGRAHLYGEWDAIYTYKLSPGETASGQNISVSQGGYNWQTHTLEAKWSPENWTTKILLNPGQWSLRMGLQQHLVPFITRPSSSIAEVQTNSVTMVSLGGQYQEMLSNHFDFEFYMRMQYPLATGDLFEIDSSFAFDGSLGLIYNFFNGLRFGVFWYGQLQTYQLKSYDSLDNVDVSGDLNLFYSNIDLRLGYAFD